MNATDHAQESNSHEMNETDHAKESKTHNANATDHAKESKSHETHDMATELQTNNGTKLHSDIKRGNEELKTMLRHYGCGRNGLILMLRDFSQDMKNTEFQRDIDAAQKTALHDLLTLELDEQKNHDLELSKLRDPFRSCLGICFLVRDPSHPFRGITFLCMIQFISIMGSAFHCMIRCIRFVFSLNNSRNVFGWDSSRIVDFVFSLNDSRNVFVWDSSRIFDFVVDFIFVACICVIKFVH
jgi:hypothetical protein